MYFMRIYTAFIQEHSGREEGVERGCGSEWIWINYTWKFEQVFSILKQLFFVGNVRLTALIFFFDGGISPIQFRLQNVVEQMVNVRT